MPCFYPIPAWRAQTVHPSTRKRGIVFNPRDGFADMALKVPCGQCIGCRLERSRQWAIRCLHESGLHERNCFITLTYDDEHLPEGGTLVKQDWQLFIDRLRKRFRTKVRYFHCGEYGEQTRRPHYHAILFGHDFDDKTLWKRNHGNPLYRSKSLERLWPHGYSSIGACT